VSFLFKGVCNKKQLQMLIKEASQALDLISEKPEFKKQECEIRIALKRLCLATKDEKKEGKTIY
jgi:hypothetical protein